MNQIPFSRISSTQLSLLTSEANIVFKLLKLQCGDLASTLTTGSVPLVNPLLLNLDKDSIYSLSFEQDGFETYTTHIHTYESIEYAYIRKFQKYVCGCGCSGNCDETSCEGLLEVYTIGQHLLGLSLNKTSVESELFEKYFCSTSSFLKQATTTNMLYGGSLTKPEDILVPAIQTFITLFLKEYTLASSKSDVLIKWRIENVKDCLNKVSCFDIDTVTKVYDFEFNVNCDVAPPTPLCEVDAVTLMLNQILLDVETSNPDKDILSTSAKITLFRDFLRQGYTFPNTQSCCPDCEEAPYYLFGEAPALSTYFNRDKCCGKVITKEGANPVSYTTDCGDLATMQKFYEYSNSEGSDFSFAEINTLTSGENQVSLFDKDFWLTFINDFFSSPAPVDIDSIFAMIQKELIGVVCTVEEGSSVIKVGCLDFVQPFLPE